MLSPDITLNKNLNNDSILNNIHLAFKNKSDFTDGDIKLKSSPFQTCEISNFLADENYLNNLISQVNKLDFCDRNNDLYSFSQSEDLNNIEDVLILQFKNILKFEFKKWLENVTKISLNSEINLTASKYKENDVLLCHDDELDNRRIAFTFYLTSECWVEVYGGLLKLFNVSDAGEPESINREIIPMKNKLIWFEVSENSYHEVSEILSETESRLSLHGWFQSKPVPRKFILDEQISTYLSPIHVELELVTDWISEQYLDTASQDKIRQKFEDQSEIQLPNFLKKQKYENLMQILSKNTNEWVHIGPPNKRNYDRMEHTEEKEISSVLDLFKSEAMMLILSNMTGLNLHPLFGEKNDISNDNDEIATNNEDVDNNDDEIPSKRLKKDFEPSIIRSKFKYELIRWQHGGYKLMFDSKRKSTNRVEDKFFLDAFIYIVHKSMNFDVGGYTTYVSGDDGDQLLTVEPMKNCLNLVYREQDTRKFVKFINNKINKSQEKQFYELNFTYIEE